MCTYEKSRTYFRWLMHRVMDMKPRFGDAIQYFADKREVQEETWFERRVDPREGVFFAMFGVVYHVFTHLFVII
jgi:hypothetical protein